MVLISDDRFISRNGEYGISPGYETYGHYWSISTSYARQFSGISEYRLNGFGDVNYTTSYDYVHTSVFSATFTVDETLEYNLTGELYAPYADVYARLWENGTLLFSETVPRFSALSEFTQSGLFEIGNEYTLTFSARRIGSSFARYDDYWDFTMNTQVVPVSPVPLPAAGWLMISALVFLFTAAPRRYKN